MTSLRSANSSPTLLLDDELIARLRDDLTAADWTVASLEERLSPMALAAMKRDQFTPAAMELEKDSSSAAVLTRLFMLAEVVESDAIELALPSLTVNGAIELGLVVRANQSHKMEGIEAQQGGDMEGTAATTTGITRYSHHKNSGFNCAAGCRGPASAQGRVSRDF